MISTCLPVCLPACLPAYLHACLPANLHACIPAYLPTCLPVNLPTCLSICLPEYIYVIWVLQVGGFGLPFFLVGSLVIVNGLIIWALLTPPTESSHPRSVSTCRLMSSPLILVTLVSIVAGAVGISFLDPTLSDHLKHVRYLLVDVCVSACLCIG